MGSANCSKGVWTVVVLACLLCAMTACGGNPWGGGLGRSSGTSASTPEGNGVKQAGLIQAVPESEIGALPLRQRELLSDAGWNQPYIAPRAGTPAAPPELASLLAETQAAMAKGQALHPRYTQGAAKGATWYGDSAGPFDEPIEDGEFADLPAADPPPYGCNSNPGNASAAGNAIEDLIEAAATPGWPLPGYCLSYVREGLCSVNYFNSLAGANKNASAAVYQAYCSINQGGFDPQNPPLDAKVAELSYRSSLVPSGEPGGTCAATAYAVRDYFWRAFNGSLDAIPNGPVDLYNVLIAPAGNQSVDDDSPGGTTGWYQPFYFGTMGNCYGGAWIVGLKASTSYCAIFKQYFDPSSPNYVQPNYWYRPIYGVLLQRWQELGLSEGQPWLGDLGWPVYGPTALHNGELQLNAKGAYYQWGMWFERGFIWWIDYDQATSPAVPDEAQAYRYTGSNVYCATPEDSLKRLGSTTYYGGSGPLGVNVEIQLYRNDPTAYWEWVPMDPAGREYHVRLPAGDGLATVTLKMHASGYGGTPNADCKYKTYVWAFRDGTIRPAGIDYSTAQQTAIHTYGDLSINKESTYVVRVQIQDEVGFAYGDSLPIVLGHMGGCGEIFVIRDDAPDYSTYNTNFKALLADLDALGAQYTVVNFSPTIAEEFSEWGCKVAIWYRGGPGVAAEPDSTTDWTAEEEEQFNLLLRHKMLLISQAHSAMDRQGSGWDSFNNYWGWDSNPNSQLCQHLDFSPMTHATDQNMGLTSNESDGCFSWQSVMLSSDMGKGKADSRGPQQLGFAAYSSFAAERNAKTGSSRKIPRVLQWATGAEDILQFCCRGCYPPFGDAWVNPGWQNGMQANPIPGGEWDGYTNEYTLLSYGNSSSGGPAWNVPGPGRFWCWGMPYAKLTVTESSPPGMTRAEVLQNVLAWLEPRMYYGYSEWDGCEPYEDLPEIVLVMPGYWTSSPAGYIRGSVVQPGVSYPDKTGTDVYRTNYTNLAGQRYISTTQAGNNGTNTNDLDFQFPWYAYITTTDGTVETSSEATVVPPTLSTNDSLLIKGLLVEDGNENWSRYTPPAGELPNCQLNLNLPASAVAGYFASSLGDDGDEVYATYGVDPPALTWDNHDKLEVEAIAHWPESLMYGAAPARLYWSMYPGHRMFVPGSRQVLTETADGWYSFRRIFDIDPAADPPGRAGSSWNAGVFTYTSIVADGRVVAFDYSKITAWNPDLNLDGDANLPDDTLPDKFPIRCRLFSNYATYTDSDPVAPGMQPYTWPNNQPPLASYVEGGCYVVDTGPRILAP